MIQLPASVNCPPALLIKVAPETKGFLSIVTSVNVNFPRFIMAPPESDVPAVIIIPLKPTPTPAPISKGLGPELVIIMSSARDRMVKSLVMLIGLGPTLIVRPESAALKTMISPPDAQLTAPGNVPGPVPLVCVTTRSQGGL